MFGQKCQGHHPILGFQGCRRTSASVQGRGEDEADGEALRS